MIWAPPGVDDEPRIALTRWSVVEIDWDKVEDSRMSGKTRHFVGEDVVNGGGRVSSPIQSWDAEKGEGITRSGRRYSVDDTPIASITHDLMTDDAAYVFGRWRVGNGISDEACLDVTKEYLKK